MFADALPKSAEGRTSSYVAALRRCSARVAQLGDAAPSHTTLLAAEGCIIHKCHAALLSASVAATRSATEEFHEGISLLAARIELPAGLDLSTATAHLAAVKSCTLPLCVPGSVPCSARHFLNLTALTWHCRGRSAKMLCLRECAAAAVRANATANGAVQGSGADVLIPLLLLLLARGSGVPDVLAHIHFAENYFLVNGCAGEDDPRKSELGYIATSFDAACAHLRAAGRAALQPSMPVTLTPAKAVTPGRASQNTRRSHSRNPSAPAMLELVAFQGDAATAEPQVDEEQPEAAVDDTSARPGRWASPFARWRARAPAAASPVRT